MAERVVDKFIVLNGARFHYRDWENASAPALILLHGFARNARMFDPFARDMQSRFRVLALDLRGHGETEWAKNYSTEQSVEDLEALRRALGLWQFSLFGHSMGGTVAYLYAAQHPDAVTRLVIGDAGPETLGVGLSRIRSIVQMRETFDSIEDAFEFARTMNPKGDDDAQRERTRSNLMQRADGKWTWRYDSALRQPNPPITRPDPKLQWEALKRIQCPTLLIRGSQTDVLGRDTAERMIHEIPNCKMVELPKSGHQVPFDEPKEFSNAVLAFLTSV